MKALVTGAAGFLGSHLATRLLAEGHEVVGVDCITPYYDPLDKMSALAPLLGEDGFCWLTDDLATASLAPLLEGVDVVFHQAGQPGVRASWGEDFSGYVRNNILATQRLLEAMAAVGVPKLVHASSSSVYGDALRLPTSEQDLPAPVSPYGVSKLSAEQLGRAYASSMGIDVTALRYFTVYGPGQRPDMAFRLFCEAVFDGRPITMFGDGGQTRDFTFVEDAVEANMLAATKGKPGAVYNIGGGSRVSLAECLDTLQVVSGKTVLVDRQADRLGDVRHTGADTSLAHADLGYAPKTTLIDGLAAEWMWVDERRRREAQDPSRGLSTVLAAGAATRMRRAGVA
ncbi:MAG: NAD-dependent epimerase/dehydratase [Frankiales bacterium]|nr:NAD-dependent epimerase/dehydratase [Frankiales bacterium]